MKRNETEPIEIVGGTLVKLHKVLSESDQFKAQNIHRDNNKRGGFVYPLTIIDFSRVHSIQEDYARGGTVVLEGKNNAVIVSEPIDAVLDAWLEVKEYLDS